MLDKSLKKIISDGFANLSSVFNSEKQTESALGIDIGSSSIKVVQLKKKGGRAILETYGALALGPYASSDVGAVTNLSSTDIAKALVDVMRESNVTIKSGVISIPSSVSLIFTISLPDKVDEDHLAEIIPLEARKYIPVPISEVMLDWSIIPREPESFIEINKSKDQGDLSNEPVANAKKVEPKLEVLVVAIHNEILTRYQEIAEKAEIKTNAYEMEVFGSIRSSLHDLSPVLLMDFGASKTKLSIIEAGIVRVFHIVNRGSSDITKNISQSLSTSFVDAEKLKRSVGLGGVDNKEVGDIVRLSMDYIFSETNSVVFAYEKKYNKSVSKVILTGGGSLMKGLLEKAQENFHTEVIYADPFSRVEAPAFLQPILKTSGPEFSIALGLALRQLS